MDIADAYPETCGLSSYLREAVLWKNKEILIRDTFSFTSCPDETPEEPAVLLNLMTCAKPVSCGTSDDVCFRIGDLGILSIKGGRLFQQVSDNEARIGTYVLCVLLFCFRPNMINAAQAVFLWHALRLSVWHFDFIHVAPSSYSYFKD